MEPGNRQAQELEKAIKSEMESEALKGAAMAGGGLLAAGALVALGMALLKKWLSSSLSNLIIISLGHYKLLNYL